MSSFDKINKGECPNDCGPLTVLKKPISKLLLISEDLCDLGGLEGIETPMDMFGHILGVCPECGFIVGTPPTYEYDYDIHQWVPSSEVNPE